MRCARSLSLTRRVQFTRFRINNFIFACFADAVKRTPVNSSSKSVVKLRTGRPRRRPYMEEISRDTTPRPSPSTD